MLCLFKSEDDITLDHIWLLLTLFLKGDLVSILHTSFDIDSELFTFLHNSFTSACFAIYSIDFTLTSTLCARLLHLHLHNAHIHKLHCDTFSFASWAFLLLSAFSTRALAFRAVDVSVDCERAGNAIVKFF